jgi:hypothetical protein
LIDLEARLVKTSGLFCWRQYDKNNLRGLGGWVRIQLLKTRAAFDKSKKNYLYNQNNQNLQEKAEIYFAFRCVHCIHVFMNTDENKPI